MKNIINSSNNKENFKENLLETIKNKIFSLIESGKDKDELTLLETWEENYPKWAKENLKDFFGTIVINEEKNLVRVGNLVWDISFNKKFFTQEQAKRLEKNGYRLPKSEDIKYTISYMPGYTKQEQLVNLLELLGKPYNGFYNHHDQYGTLVGYNKIACFWIFEEESYCMFKKDNSFSKDLDLNIYSSNPDNFFPIFLVKDAY